MKKTIQTLAYAATLLAAIFISAPVFAEEKDKHDHGAEGHKPHAGDDAHEGHEDHAGHGKKAPGMGKTDIKEISALLNKSLKCMEKELGSPNHGVFHSCLEAVVALGQDLIALKTPADSTKKKRVNGYAKNLGMMAHKVDEYMDGKQPEKARNQLKKLKAQVEMIEGQFEELVKNKASGK